MNMSVTDSETIDYDIKNDNEVFNILGKILDTVNKEEQELEVCAYVSYISYVQINNSLLCIKRMFIPNNI